MKPTQGQTVAKIFVSSAGRASIRYLKYLLFAFKSPSDDRDTEIDGESERQREKTIITCRLACLLLVSSSTGLMTFSMLDFRFYLCPSRRTFLIGFQRFVLVRVFFPLGRSRRMKLWLLIAGFVSPLRNPNNVVPTYDFREPNIGTPKTSESGRAEQVEERLIDADSNNATR